MSYEAENSKPTRGQGMANIPIESLTANVFEERAEYLSKGELAAWTASTKADRAILAKLKGPGAKLLIGPRGCGKSTLLRRAYFELQEEAAHLGVYVNYSRSLALEPLFHKSANALQLFRQWVLLKIAVGVKEALKEGHREIPDTLAELTVDAQAYIKALEAGTASSIPDVYTTPTELLHALESWTQDSGMKRCVLLLDDAAHAFSPDQQREFFEIFRELRSRTVSAKAAVYPGITSYSPNFHVGHEAELVESWLRPDEDGYLEVMREIVNRRIPTSHLKRLKGREELIDYLALASFGLPRGFLVMLSQLLGVEEDETHNPTRKMAETAISDHAASVRQIFSTLAGKLPRYKHFVDFGQELEAGSVRQLQNFNAARRDRSKATVIAFREPMDAKLTRMVAMLEYAGILRDAHTVSRGVKGVFHRYMLHYAILIEGNALGLGKAFAVSDIISALVTRDAHAFSRLQPTNVLGADYEDRCTLDLLPCQNCGAPRYSEDAQFCMKCGRQLRTASIYEELLKAPIDNLPLTKKKRDGLLKYTEIRTVNDILLDEENAQIRRVPHIGPVWAKRIKSYAEEFVSV
ncbi:AAA family ATPase [Streptomyces viridosporus]|uniref:ORC-CDC6 family AAA ATPase n=1 Tax=Streptomyces viridosporus TaxID=67581 RepID=UPI00332ED2AE